MAQTLTEQATDIINQEVHTPEDIKDLARIKFLMSKQYADACKIAWQMEDSYNKDRSTKTKEALDQNMPAGKADDIWKFYAECSWSGVWRREAQSTLKGMSAVLQAISWFIIARSIENKAAWAFLDSNQ